MTAALLALFMAAFVSRFYMPEPGVSAVGTWFVAVHFASGFLLGAAFPCGHDNRLLAAMLFATLLMLEIAMFPHATWGIG